VTASPGVRAYGFADAPDYIEKITYAIWNGPDRDPSLVARYYGPDTPIHMDGGDLYGADAVVANTEARLVAFPDFHGVIDDTIWAGDEESGYRTSMRWTWTATNTGPSAFGPPTGREVRFSAIADCVVRGQVIVREWLASNPLALAAQLGLDHEQALARLAPPAPGIADVRPEGEPSSTGPGRVVADAMRACAEGDVATVTRAYAPEAVVTLGPDRGLAGAAGVAAWGERWRAAVPGLTWSLDDQYGRPAERGLPERVATRWTLAGEGVRVRGISHHHLAGGRIVAEWTHYDELALLAQGVAELP
jgi:predicted ester cyclase